MIDWTKCISGKTHDGFYVLDPSKVLAELQQKRLEEF